MKSMNVNPALCAIKEEEQSEIIQSEKGDTKFDAKKFKRNLEKRGFNDKSKIEAGTLGY